MPNMPDMPNIVVQIVHIEGFRKGEIDEIDKSRISIGRDPSCDVVFPKELRIVSRRHAEINREGNRFLLKNLSKNGSYVNGQPVTEDIYLKQGDVMAFSQGGPKVSFLTKVQAKPAAAPQPKPIIKATPPAPPRVTPKPTVRPPIAPKPKPNFSSGRSTSAPINTNESAPFTIQYGTSIRSFKQPSVKIGKNSSNHFALEHPRVLDSHAEIFFSQKQYYLRDLSGCNATILNGRPINSDTPLHENDIITFSENGPRLKYLSSGRLAEYFEQNFQSAPNETPSFSLNDDDLPLEQKDPSVKDLFKSFFKK